jgi:hypothetical protein
MDGRVDRIPYYLQLKTSDIFVAGKDGYLVHLDRLTQDDLNNIMIVWTDKKDYVDFDLKRLRNFLIKTDVVCCRCGARYINQKTDVIKCRKCEKQNLSSVLMDQKANFTIEYEYRDVGYNTLEDAKSEIVAGGVIRDKENNIIYKEVKND